MLKTSPDFKRFLIVDLPLACDANSTHLIEQLLSPSILMLLLTSLIFLFITNVLDF